MPSVVALDSGPVVLFNELVMSDSQAGSVRAAAPRSGPVPNDEVATLHGTWGSIRAASIGNEAFAAWSGHSGVLAARVGSDGRPLDGPLTVDSGSNPEVAAASDRYLVVWQKTNSLHGAIYGRNANLLRAPFDILQGRSIAWVSAASNGEDFLITWAEGTNDLRTQVIRSMVVEGDGFVRPETERVVATGANFPDVVWNGRDYAIFWSELDHGIRARRVAADGMTFSQIVVVTTIRDQAPRVAWDGWGYAIAYLRETKFNQYTVRFVSVSRFAPDFTQSTHLAGIPVGIATLATGAYDVAARNGKAYFVFEGEQQRRIFLRTGELPPPPPRRVRATR